MNTESIIIAIIGSGVLSTVVSAIITALSNRKNRLKEIESKIDKITENQHTAEKDALRAQLLFMIVNFPDETKEILTIGERYFAQLHGDWFATPIFNRWCLAHGIQPEWFDVTK